jgi:HPr kinase/phosphorylase
VRRKNIPLFSTPLPAAQVIDYLRVYLSKKLAQQITMHGVFMDVLGVGVLITGESGLGKSELGLELISRSHGLVADDAVEFARIAPNMIEGRCPPLLQNLLEVRGLGLLDIKAIFGETAVRRKMRLKLIVHLVRRSTLEENYERLPLDAQPRKCWACRSARWSFPWRPAATSRCCWKRPCATPSCNCAASIPSRNSSSASGAP